MKTFTCVCGTPVHFQNARCQHGGRSLGFLPDQLQICAINALGNGLFRAALPVTSVGAYRRCRNYGFEHVGNWLVAADDESPYGRACRLNDTIPNLSADVNRVRWCRVEQAKRRPRYTLLRLRLPQVVRDQNPGSGLTFASFSPIRRPARRFIPDTKTAGSPSTLPRPTIHRVLAQAEAKPSEYQLSQGVCHE